MTGCGLSSKNALQDHNGLLSRKLAQRHPYALVALSAVEKRGPAAPQTEFQSIGSGNSVLGWRSRRIASIRKLRQW